MIGRSPTVCRVALRSSDHDLRDGLGSSRVPTFSSGVRTTSPAGIFLLLLGVGLTLVAIRLVRPRDGGVLVRGLADSAHAASPVSGCETIGLRFP